MSPAMLPELARVFKHDALHLHRTQVWSNTAGRVAHHDFDPTGDRSRLFGISRELRARASTGDAFLDALDEALDEAG